MLRTYTLHCNPYQMLHRFMMAFLMRMEKMVDAGEVFSDNVFPVQFADIARRHKTSIYKHCENIFNYYAALDEPLRKTLAARAREGMDIEKICHGMAKPLHVKEIPEPLSTEVKETFENLYTAVLRGKEEDSYVKKYGTIRQHFESFFYKNSEVTLCLFCGISPVRTDAMMEYDHYLPKSLYPLHAINLKNLVPTCKDCNQTEKGAFDVIGATTGKLFYPYDKTFTGIDIIYRMIPKPEIADSEWFVALTNKQGLEDEVKSWMMIYGIESRYINFAKIRAKKWWNSFMGFAIGEMKEGKLLNNICDTYRRVLKSDEEHQENFLKKPAFDALFRDSSLLAALEESKLYS